MRGTHDLGTTTTRRGFLKGGLGAALAAGLPSSLHLSGCAGGSSPSAPTRVVLISIDTLRADHLGCYGYARATSPTLDRIARRGLLFEDVTSTCPWTLPAHASLLTGLYPRRNGVRTRRDRLPADVPTLAEVFREHGFVTGAIVNCHWLSEANGLHRGFDDFTYVREDVKQVAPSAVGERARQWLTAHAGAPFFLFLHYYDVHSDYRSLPHYQDQFVRPYRGATDGSTLQLIAARYGHLKLDKADIEHLVDLYDASIRQLDDGIARLFGVLEENGLLEDTLVIITADHGEEFLEHGGVLHGQTHFQENVHVPLIVCGPGVPRDRRQGYMTSLVDVPATILGIVGLDPPPGDGLDLSRLWRPEGPELPSRFVFAEADWNNAKNDIRRAVREPHYKLHYDLLTEQLLVFDLSQDPGEKLDIASQRLPVAQSLRHELGEFMRVSRSTESAPELTPEAVEHLRSLGYVD
jgi:arylsulfatase A-like enzyme